MVKGVYANIDEFRNNQPSITRYELSQDRSGSLEVRIYKKNKLYVPSFLLFPGVPLWAADWTSGWTPIDLGTLRSLRLYRLDAKTGDVIN